MFQLFSEVSGNCSYLYTSTSLLCVMNKFFYLLLLGEGARGDGWGVGAMILIRPLYQAFGTLGASLCTLCPILCLMLFKMLTSLLKLYAFFECSSRLFVSSALSIAILT